MKNGVYQIRNRQNNKCYVGSTAANGGFDERWKDHRKLLRGNRHHSRKLQNAWNKHNESSFVFEVLLYCDPENCLMYEQIALDHYKPEYNICKIATSALGVKRSDETKGKLRKLNIGLHQGEDNISSKIDGKTVLAILNDMKSGMRSPAISKKYNLSLTQTKAIMSGKSWSHISVDNEIDQLRQQNKAQPNLGSRQGGAKLVEDDIPKIRSLIKDGQPIRDIAIQFGVSISCIKNIKYNTRWSHI